MHPSDQTHLVSESKELIMRRVKHLLEVASLEQVVLTYQHLTNTKLRLKTLDKFYANILWHDTK